MSITSNSLLMRLQTAASDADWRRLVDVYAPVVRGWLARYHLQPADADDLVQDVLGVLVRELPAFRHNGRTGAFRHWLRVVAVHRVRNFWRTKQSAPSPGLIDDLAQLEDAASDLSRQWDAEHDKHVAGVPPGHVRRGVGGGSGGGTRHLAERGVDREVPGAAPAPAGGGRVAGLTRFARL